MTNCDQCDVLFMCWQGKARCIRLSDDDACEICHEPLTDGCQCQEPYNREHDRMDLER